MKKFEKGYGIRIGGKGGDRKVGGGKEEEGN